MLIGHTLHHRPGGELWIEDIKVICSMRASVQALCGVAMQHADPAGPHPPASAASKLPRFDPRASSS